MLGGFTDVKRMQLVLMIVVMFAAAACTSSTPKVEPSAAAKKSGSGIGHLRSGSNPSVLPGPILIVDEDNNRLLEVDPQGRVVWEFPRPGDLVGGQTFITPDDAFFTPD